MTGRLVVVAWAVAWGATGTGLAAADVFSTPRHGPMWPIVVGVVGWAAAGAVTAGLAVAPRLVRPMWMAGAVWGGAYLLVLPLAGPLVRWADENLGSAGFIGGLIAWSIGAATAGAATTWIVRPRASAFDAFAAAITWAPTFFACGYAAIVLGMLTGQTVKVLLSGLVESGPAFIAGWGLGWAVAGLPVGLVAVAMSRQRR